MEQVRIRTLPETVTSSAITDEQAQAMARAVVNLFRHWKITDTDACTLLGGISQRSYSSWKTSKFGKLGTDIKTRLSIMLGIHKALRILFQEPTRG